MIEFVQGELKPLLHARFESHLLSCRRCTDLQHSIQTGLEHARSYEPEIDPAHLERLHHRLQPYIQRATPERTPFMAGLSFAAAAAAVALLFVTLGDRSPSPTPVRVVVAEAKKEPVEVERTVVGTTRVVASTKLRGKLDAKRFEVRDGFLIAKVAPGADPIEIEAPNVSVTSAGSVFVEVVDGELTTVGAVSKSVNVQTPRGLETLSEGERKSFGKGGAVAPAKKELEVEVFVNDSFLAPREDVSTVVEEPDVEPVAEVVPPKQQRKVRRRAKARRGRPKGAVRRARAIKKAETKDEIDLLESFARAEGLARKGRVVEAIELYQSILDDARPAYAPYKGLVRYEIARLRGFSLGQVERARSELSDLARRGHGEVATQAAFALCELEVEEAPCAAKQCLMDIERSGSEGVRTEARTLLTRWGLEEAACED